MGRTSMEGPVYGAKSLLYYCQRETIGTGSTDVEQGQITVPATEDWYITNVSAYSTTAGTTGSVNVLKGTTTILGSAITLSAGADVKGTITTTPGEDEGKLVAGGSVLSVQATVGATTAATNVQVSVFGYIRYKR